jgi:hypothetical protein
VRIGRLGVLIAAGTGAVFFASGPRAAIHAQSPVSPASPAGPLIQPVDSITTPLSDYLWPTDAGTIITSTFAEYRPMHFHAGIDISTGDETGFRVFAMRDGEVVRVRVSPNGYGKILYVHHADGYVTAYAHLSGFAGGLETLVEHEQRRLEQYPVDLHLPPGTFPVKKGDVIAYSGDTGIGTPHLHIEIRDPHDEPINPQLCPHLRVPDTIRPVIEKLAVLPRSDHAAVAGRGGTSFVSLSHAGSGQWVIPAPIVISGRAGFALEAYDKTADERFRRGLYRIRLSIDGRTFFEIVNNRAPLEDAQSIGLAYDWGLSDAHRGRFQKLFVDVGGILPFYRPSTTGAGLFGDGILPAGEHPFTIVAEDIAGNSASIHGILKIASPPLFTVERTPEGILLHLPNPGEIASLREDVRTPSGTWISTRLRLTGGYLLQVEEPRAPYTAVKFIARGSNGLFSAPRIVLPLRPAPGAPALEFSHEVDGDALHLVARCRGVFTMAPVAVLLEGGTRREVSLTPQDVDVFAGTIHLSPEIAGTRIIELHCQVNGSFLNQTDSCAAFPILPGRSGMYRYDRDNLRVVYDAASVFSPVFLQVTREDQGGGLAYEFSPRLAVLRDGLGVQVRERFEAPRAGIYFRSRAGLHYLGDSDATLEGFLNGRIRQTLGSLRVRTDTTPPSIRRLTLHVGRDRHIVISFGIRDNLSGVEYESVKTYIDNGFVIPEIDGEHHRVRYRSSDALERGTHHFVLRCRDRAGNVCTVQRTFRVR